MKKLILLLLLVCFGCSKNCDELEMIAFQQYQDATFRCGGSSTCRMEIQRQYNQKIKEIRQNCN